MTIIDSRLSKPITLDRGGHSSFNDGTCFNEWVSWLAGEPFSDAPQCVSPVLRRYTIALNDRWDDDQRQALIPYGPRVIGTGGDGKDQVRQEIAARFLCADLLGPWLRLAGMNERADSLAALTAATPTEIRTALYQARDEAWKLRRTARDRLEARIRVELEKRNSPAVADAVDVAVADADAAAAAAADAAAAAVADAAAAAVADAAAAAAADAAAAAAAGKPGYWAVYQAVRQHFHDHPLPIHDQIKPLAEQQQPLALQLLDAMIDPKAA